MTNKFAGWTLGVAAIGMMFGLLAVDVANLQSWQQMATPSFVGSVMAHFAAVISAFIGGKLIPTEPQDQRKDDAKP